MTTPVGEKVIHLSGRKFNLRPTFYGITQMEQWAGAGVNALAARFKFGTTGLTDITAILFGCICGHFGRWQEPNIDFDELGDLILAEGEIEFMPLCQEIIEFACTGGVYPDDAKKKASQGK